MTNLCAKIKKFMHEFSEIYLLWERTPPPPPPGRSHHSPTLPPLKNPGYANEQLGTVSVVLIVLAMQGNIHVR